MMIRKLATRILPLCLLLPFPVMMTYAQQASPGAAQQQPAPAPSQQPAPAAAPETPLNTSDNQVSVQVFGFLPSGSPDLRGGAANTGPYPGNLSYPGKPKLGPGLVISMPAGKNNTLRLSYLRLQGNGQTTTPAYLTLFDTDFNPGTVLTTSYTLQDVKLSYDFLSYPYPANPSRFRFKTLWEVNYITLLSNINAPLAPVVLDASGNPISNDAAGTRWLIYPSLGAGIEKAITPHVRFEARASGFAVPHHAVLWDADASAVFRTGRYEISVGAKAFHFKTSPQNSQYLVVTYPGVYIAFRYYPKWYWR
jgi:hypothetical protein